MIFQTGKRRYEIKPKRNLTHEAFTKRMALTNLEIKIEQARDSLKQLLGVYKRRQREKISRLERQYDKLKLEIESES